MGWVLEFAVTVTGGLPAGIEDRLQHRLRSADVIHDPPEVNAGPSVAITLVAPQDARPDAVAWGAGLVEDALRAEIGVASLEVLLQSVTAAVGEG